jgi:heme-degrading monooxygenase HmoA
METIAANAPLVVVNVFTPKPGKLEDFIAAQAAGLTRLRGRIPGLRGGRLYRAEDGSRALLVSAFDSQAKLDEWLASAAFAEHRANLTPFVERSEAMRYRMVYEAGSL